mgnify:CR=1 FL=1
MVNKEIITFIKEELANNRPKEAIKMDLLNSDYSLKEVQEAFRSLKPKKFSKTEEKSDKLIIIFFLIFIIVLSVSILLNFKYVKDLKNCQSKQVDLMGLNLVKTEFCKQAQIILTIIRINIVLTGIASAYLGFLLIKS